MSSLDEQNSGRMSSPSFNMFGVRQGGRRRSLLMMLSNIAHGRMLFLGEQKVGRMRPLWEQDSVRISYLLCNRLLVQRGGRMSSLFCDGFQ